jgi:hypothetical protein
LQDDHELPVVLAADFHDRAVCVSDLSKSTIRSQVERSQYFAPSGVIEET